MAQPTTSLEELSKVVFNAQHRLSVARVFLDSEAGAMRCDDVAKRASVSQSVTHKELQVLVRIRAVQRLETSRAVFFLRTESEFWAFCRELSASASKKLSRSSSPIR